MLCVGEAKPMVSPSIFILQPRSSTKRRGKMQVRTSDPSYEGFDRKDPSFLASCFAYRSQEDQERLPQLVDGDKHEDAP